MFWQFKKRKKLSWLCIFIAYFLFIISSSLHKRNFLTNSRNEVIQRIQGLLCIVFLHWVSCSDEAFQKKSPPTLITSHRAPKIAKKPKRNPINFPQYYMQRKTFSNNLMFTKTCKINRTKKNWINIIERNCLSYLTKVSKTFHKKTSFNLITSERQKKNFWQHVRYIHIIWTLDKSQKN